MFFLGVGKDPFYRFLVLRIQQPVFRRITGIVSQFLGILSDLPLNGLDAVFGMGSQVSRRAVGASVGITFVLAASVPVGRDVV